MSRRLLLSQRPACRQTRMRQTASSKWQIGDIIPLISLSKSAEYGIKVSERNQTERLLLHPLHIDHVDTVYALRSDPKVFYWKTPENRLQSDEQLEARLVSKKSLIYIVELRASLQHKGPASHPLPEQKPRIIGLAGAHTLPEIGYLFTPYSWGHGYATEALQAWMEWYWTMWPGGHPSVDESERGCLKAETGPDGVGSRGVLRKCGFKHTGTREVEEEGGRVVLDCWRCERRS